MANSAHTGSPPEGTKSASFHWEMDGLDKNRFCAWTKVLVLRYGRQVEEVSRNVKDDEEDEEDVGEFDETCTVLAGPSSGSELKQLKRSFLDRLAELLSNRAGGRHICASAMVEGVSQIDILVAKNNGMEKKILQHMADFQAQLRRLSELDPLSPSRDVAETQLWRKILSFYRSRLVDYVCVTKRQLTAWGSHGGGQSSVSGNSNLLKQALTDFSTLLHESTTPPQWYEDVVEMAYGICMSYQEQSFVNLMGVEKTGKNLRQSVSFLARPRRCYNTFIDSADRLPNFKSLRLIGLSYTAQTSKPYRRGNEWTAAKALESLGLRMDASTMADYFRGSSLNKFKERFASLESQEWQVHAEVQILAALVHHETAHTQILDYIGCSRRSCLLCSGILRAYGNLTTRACHGKIYDLWNVPRIPNLTETKALRVSCAVKQLESMIRDAILSESKPKLQEAKESTAGESDMSNLAWHFENFGMATLALQVLERQHDEEFAAKWSNKTVDNVQGLEEMSHDIVEPPAFHGDSASPLSALKEVGLCSSCDVETERNCSFCQLDWFCSDRCEEQMDLSHLQKCCARSIMSADYLAADVYHDELPQDPEARSDFGFNRCRNKMEESHLLGLYQGLLKVLDVSSRDLNGWKQTGTIVEETVRRFSEVLPESRGSYYPWFLANKERIFPSINGTKRESEPHNVLAVLERARHRLEPNNQDKDLTNLQPQAKNLCYLFFAYISEGTYPNPTRGGSAAFLWYELGFVTFQGEWEESKLGVHYQQLLWGDKYYRDHNKSLGTEWHTMAENPVCSFDEFWRAWESRTLVDLFAKYGRDKWTNERSQVLLNEFLSAPQSQPRPSIWLLKHMLVLDETTPLSRFPHIREAVKEYGFNPRMDTRVKLELKEFYKTLLKNCDPLEVYQAKVEGKLHSYSWKVLTEFSPEVKYIVQNAVKHLQHFERIGCAD